MAGLAVAAAAFAAKQAVQAYAKFAAAPSGSVFGPTSFYKAGPLASSVYRHYINNHVG